MSAVEYKTMSKDELKTKLSGLRSEQLSLKLQSTSGQLKQKHLLLQKRREIARVLTLINSY